MAKPIKGGLEEKAKKVSIDIMVSKPLESIEIILDDHTSGERYNFNHQCSKPANIELCLVDHMYHLQIDYCYRDKFGYLSEDTPFSNIIYPFKPEGVKDFNLPIKEHSYVKLTGLSK